MLVLTTKNIHTRWKVSWKLHPHIRRILVDRVISDFLPLFAVIRSYTLLGSVSTGCWSMDVGISEIWYWCRVRGRFGVHSSSSRRFSLRFRSGLCAGHSNSTNHDYMKLALCTGIVMMKRLGPLTSSEEKPNSQRCKDFLDYCVLPTF